MADDLRTRLESALQPYCWYEFASTGDVITLVDLDDVLDAVVPVAEELLLDASEAAWRVLWPPDRMPTREEVAR